MSAMVVEVKLFATFRENRFKEKGMELAEGSSVAKVLAHLKIPQDQLGILLVNGRDASVGRKLAPNDVVSIFPAIGGG
jgi:molybdopterin converting factor small subunit